MHFKFMHISSTDWALIKCPGVRNVSLRTSTSLVCKSSVYPTPETKWALKSDGITNGGC